MIKVTFPTSEKRGRAHPRMASGHLAVPSDSPLDLWLTSLQIVNINCWLNINIKISYPCNAKVNIFMSLNF